MANFWLASSIMPTSESAWSKLALATRSSVTDDGTAAGGGMDSSSREMAILAGQVSGNMVIVNGNMLMPGHVNSNGG